MKVLWVAFGILLLASSNASSIGEPNCADGDCTPDRDYKKFHVCISGKWIIKSCPEHGYFNQTLMICVHEDGNWDNIVNKPIAGTKNFHPYICLGQPSGRKISYCYDLKCATGDCTKFITCNDDIGVAKQCPPGKHFDRSYQTCDEPKKAECAWH